MYSTIKANQDDFKDALKLKIKYQNAMSCASTMLHSIRTSEEWDWANNPKQIQKIEKMVEPLSALNDFGRSFMTVEVRELKKRHTEDVWKQGLRDFLSLSGHVEALSNYLSTVAGMHSRQLFGK